jgi:RNA polymerase sigma factor (sigma-70 family)
VLRHAHDAEDAFQATFLVLARKAESLRRRERVGNWLYGTAYRAALEARAARRRTGETQVSAMPEPEAPDDDAADWSDLRAVLDHELNRLPDKYRTAVVLCDLEGRTRRDVAAELGVPEGTLSGRLTTARRLLAKRLARHGPALSGGALGGVMSAEAALAGVSPPLVQATVQAALPFALRDAVTAGAASAKVAALTEGVMKSMLLTKIKFATAVVVALGLLGTGVGVTLGLRPTAAAEPQPPATKKASPPAKTPATTEVLDPVVADRYAALERQIQALAAELESLRKTAKPAAPAAPALAKPDIKIFRLKNGDAEEIAKTLQQLFQDQPGGWGSQGVVGKRFRIATHASTNSVLVQASADDLETIAAVIMQLDERSSAERKKPSKMGN